jgi:hypothetical protein
MGDVAPRSTVEGARAHARRRVASRPSRRPSPADRTPEATRPEATRTPRPGRLRPTRVARARRVASTPHPRLPPVALLEPVRRPDPPRSS